MASYTVIILPNTPDAQQEKEIRLTIEVPPLPLSDTTPAGADYFEVLEQRIIEFGVQIQRKLFAYYLLEAESKLCEVFSCHDCGCNVVRDGHTSLKIATRFGVVNVDRQILECKSCGKHFIPLNSIFPENKGMIITRRLQELACLLPIFMSYRTAQRLLGWFCHDSDILFAREVEELVNQHGAEVRKQEKEEISVIENSSDRETVTKRLNEVTSFWK